MIPPESELEETRAALAPTLEATAAILPWLARPRKPRFPPEQAGRWQEICERLAAIWSERHREGLAGLRPAVFELYGAALELADGDCLRLAEALASATDRLEGLELPADPRLTAALSATFECISGPECLEQEAFPERARHFAERLERCADPRNAAQMVPQRSATIDRLFISEAGECLEHVQEALAVLPPDAYGVKLAAEDLVRLAEPLELDGISVLAGRLIRLLTPRPGQSIDLDEETTRSATLNLVAELEAAISAIGTV